MTEENKIRFFGAVLCFISGGIVGTSIARPKPAESGSGFPASALEGPLEVVRLAAHRDRAAIQVNNYHRVAFITATRAEVRGWVEDLAAFVKELKK